MSIGSKTVCYYVTGHGFGHGTRAVGLIEELLSRGITVEIISSLPPEFFLENLACAECPLSPVIHCRMLDAGALQLDPLRMDVESTLLNYLQNVHQRREELLDLETAYLRERRPDLVLADATALACAAAHSVGIPSALVTNFSWWNIYDEMLPLLEQKKSTTWTKTAFREMIDTIATDYNSAEIYFQLPGTMAPPKNYPGKLVAAPLVCRVPKKSRADILSKHGIPDDQHVVVYGFGGQKRDDQQELFRDEMLPPGWVCVVLMGEHLVLPSRRFIGLPQAVYVPDILAAAHVMLGKLGYGTCSECLATGTPLLWVTRHDWPEERPLQLLMEQYGASIQMSTENFAAGNWGPGLAAAMELRNKGIDLGPLQTGRVALKELGDAIMELV